MITDRFFRSHNFNPSENAGWEIVLPPGDRWLRWYAGTVYFGTADAIDPTIDGPAQDRVFREDVDTEAKLSEILHEL